MVVSQVACVFSVHPYVFSSNDSLSMFCCEEEEKGLQPHSSAIVKVTYAPKALNQYNEVGYFIIKARGSCGSKKFKCTGKSDGKKLSLYHCLL